MGDGQWLLGASYFSPPYNVPDKNIIFETLLGSLKSWLPSIQSAKVIGWWSGIRAIILPKRLPFIGSIPDASNCYIMGGFGSKGILWAPLLAKYLAQKLLKTNYSLPDFVDQPNKSNQLWKLNTNPSSVRIVCA